MYSSVSQFRLLKQLFLQKVARIDWFLKTIKYFSKFIQLNNLMNSVGSGQLPPHCNEDKAQGDDSINSINHVLLTGCRISGFDWLTIDQLLYLVKNTKDFKILSFLI